MHQMPLQEFDASQEDFFEQMLSSLPPSSWPDLTAAISGGIKSGDDNDQLELENQLRHHQINGGGNPGMSAAMRSLLGGGGMQFQGPGAGAGALGSMAGFRSLNTEVDDSVQALYNVFAGSMQGNAQTSNQLQPQHLHIPQDGPMPAQSFGAASISAGGGSGGGTATQPRQRVRARRGQATDPHSIAERLRRERIAERMKALQELVPNGNKTDKASMLDEIIDYVKFLQLQVKVLSMSRLGGAGVVTPLGGADVASERTNVGGVQTASTSTLTNNDNVAVTETQVAKLMEEDMGSAMQYLQGKGLCLMPISLATAISTVTGRNPIAANGHRDGGDSSSPSLSGLTVQSATLANGNGDASF